MNELLVRKAKKGDRESFGQLIMELKDQAYRMAFCYLRDEEDSMDAVCDAVEKTFKNIGKLRDDQYFTTWFMSIVINQCKQQLRKRKQMVSHSEVAIENATEPQGSDEIKMDLERYLRQLPELDRLLIYMKYYMGYTLEEIAGITELACGTVKTRIYGNLKRLRDQLEAEEV